MYIYHYSFSICIFYYFLTKLRVWCDGVISVIRLKRYFFFLKVIKMSKSSCFLFSHRPFGKMIFLKPFRTFMTSDVLQSSLFTHTSEEVLWFRHNFHSWDTWEKQVTERNPGGYLHFNERGLCYIGHLRPLEIYYKPFLLSQPWAAILQVKVLQRDNEVK